MPLVTLENLGAWLLKGNADVHDLAERFARDPRVPSWGVHPGYRMRMMAAGQPVVFWGSGSRHKLAYGVWGIGSVAGPAFYSDERSRWMVPLDLTVRPPGDWVSRDELRHDSRLHMLEVLRQPQSANPTYVTPEQFEALKTLF
jgi:hypothetical protein